jgi:hypothetical protein
MTLSSPCNCESFDDIALQLISAMDIMDAHAYHLDQYPVETNLPNLMKTIQNMGTAFPTRPVGHPTYMNQWSDYVAGRLNKLDRHALRYLCWETKIATTEQFLIHVHESGITLTARPLAGLVRSCHREWEDIHLKPTVMELAKSLVTGYTGYSPIILKWKSCIDALLDRNGPAILGEALVDSNKTMTLFFEEWYLDDRSSFTHHIVEAAMDTCRTRLARPTYALLRKLFGEFLQWSGWKPKCLTQEIARLILHDTAVGQTREILQKFIMVKSRYGDPRLEANRTKWKELPRAAMERVLLWISENPFSLLDHTYREGRGWKVCPHPEAEEVIKAAVELGL